MLEKIIQSTDDDFIKQKYKFSLALFFLFNNDINTALNIGNQVISALEKIDVFKDPYYAFSTAHIYSFYGQMIEEKSYSKKAIDCYQQLIKLFSFTKEGLASIYTFIGYDYYILREFDLALEYLFKSKSIYDSFLSDIYLAQVYIEQMDYEKAKEILYNLKVEDLGEDKIDYLHAISKYLLLVPDYGKASEVKDYLKGTVSYNPFIDDKIKNYILKLTEMYDAYNHMDKEVRFKWLDIINRALILQPNFFGLGININNIIDMINKK